MAFLHFSSKYFSICDLGDFYLFRLRDFLSLRGDDARIHEFLFDRRFGVRDGIFRISDPGSQTHTVPIFDTLIKNFWVKSTIILSVL